jgi:hypothetical protein
MQSRTDGLALRVEYGGLQLHENAGFHGNSIIA